MVDPPPFSTHILKKRGITQNMIEWIIITHCHADHDAGAFQKILESSKVEVPHYIHPLYIFATKNQYLFKGHNHTNYPWILHKKILSYGWFENR